MKKNSNLGRILSTKEDVRAFDESEIGIGGVRGDRSTLVKPFLEAAEAQDPGSENRGGETAVVVKTLSFASIPLGEPCPIHDGPNYGFSILSVSDPALSNLTIYTSRPKGGDSGIPFKVGLKLYSSDRNPIAKALWFVKTTANQAITMTVAVFIKPCLMDTVSTMFIQGADGTVADVRNADADADFIETLNGLVVNARLGVVNSSNVYRRVNGDHLGTMNGAPLAGGLMGIYTGAMMLGIDVAGTNTAVPSVIVATGNLGTGSTLGINTNGRTYGFGGTNWERVEARDSVSYLGSATPGRMALATLATMCGYDEISTRMFGVGTLPDNTTTLITGAAFVNESRESGYVASRKGRRYTVCTPDITGVAGIVGAFVATTPFYLLVAGATAEVLIRRITATIRAVGTATTAEGVIKTDTANRFSSGGTARTAQTTNGGNAVASALAQSLTLPTASAEGGGTRQNGVQACAVALGAKLEWLWKDGLIIPASGSLLVYLQNATGAATWDFEVELEEVNIQ